MIQPLLTTSIVTTWSKPRYPFSPELLQLAPKWAPCSLSIPTEQPGGSFKNISD